MPTALLPFDRSIRDPPGTKPLEVLPLLITALHAETDVPEQPEQTDDDAIENAEKAPLYGLGQRPCDPVDTEAKGDDGKPQCRIVVVDIGNTTHDDEGQIVQEPANHRINSGVVDVIDVGGLQLLESTLPAKRVPGNKKSKDAKRGRGSPVHNRVAEKEVFDGVVIPRTHAQTDVEDGPLPEFGR